MSASAGEKTQLLARQTSTDSPKRASSSSGTPYLLKSTKSSRKAEEDDEGSNGSPGIELSLSRPTSVSLQPLGGDVEDHETVAPSVMGWVRSLFRRRSDHASGPSYEAISQNKPRKVQ
jgi:hypothetical protein